MSYRNRDLGISLISLISVIYLCIYLLHHGGQRHGGRKPTAIHRLANLPTFGQGGRRHELQLTGNALVLAH